MSPAARRRHARGEATRTLQKDGSRAQRAASCILRRLLLAGRGRVPDEGLGRRRRLLRLRFQFVLSLRERSGPVRLMLAPCVAPELGSLGERDGRRLSRRD